MTPGLNIISPKPLLKPENIAVSAEGELVAIQIGNTTLKMHYEDAFRLSQFIRVRAKQAKTAAGDTRRHWSTVAVLDGLVSDKDKETFERAYAKPI